MDASYDAQRNEFSAYVLAESETPFGMTLGNFKTYATSTGKGGVRGLWDADTDQIIFGAHQIAYRVGGGSFVAASSAAARSPRWTASSARSPADPARGRSAGGRSARCAANAR